jgi:hypothetical protein
MGRKWVADGKATCENEKRPAKSGTYAGLKLNGGEGEAERLYL